MKTQCLFIVTVLTLVGCSYAWGPISHYDFACRTVKATDMSEVDCLCGKQPSYYLLVGADMPDGFGFGDHEDGICDYALHMHDPIFAGYQLLWAMNTSINTDPRMIDMAAGYATHLIADLVGFDTTYGFLPRTRPPQYINLWFDMQIIDAMIYMNVSNNKQISCELPSQPLDAAGIAFFAKTSYMYSQINAKFQALNFSQVAECTNRWASILNGLNALAYRTLMSTIENLVPFYDPFNPSSFDDAMLDFTLSRHCIEEAAKTYFNSLLALQKSPEQSWQQTRTAVQQLFTSGQCTRSGIKTQKPQF